MKKIVLTAAVIILCSHLMAQSVGINNVSPDASAILDVKSNVKGMLIPRTSSVSRIAIINPAKGLILYDTTTNGFWFHNGTAWMQLAGGTNGWNLSGNAGTNPASQFIGTTDEKSLRFRINNTWAGEIHPTNGNIYLGLNSGQANTLGAANTAIGEHALRLNTEGSFNTANGYESLSQTTTGYSNTGIGGYALFHNTLGLENTATGRNALFANTQGSTNTANGVNALMSNISGDNNTAIGHNALQNNNASYNTATGSAALMNNTEGYANTGNGFGALTSNTLGDENIAIGYGALHDNTIGEGNAATGTVALYSNTSGNHNVAVGGYSLSTNTTASENVAVGYLALRNQNFSNNINSWVSGNTAIGFEALYYNNPISTFQGTFNTSLGHASLRSNTFGSSNNAVGNEALYLNIDGSYNNAVGNQALYHNIDGASNTALGEGALYNNIGGFENIAIGYGSGTHPSAPNVYNTISIGNFGYLNAWENQAFIGNFSTAWIGGRTTWSTYSDARIKNNISEDVKGIDFISRLRPVTYYISNKAITTLTDNKETPDYPGKNDNEKVKCSGFIAQEVEQAAIDAGYNFSGVTIPRNDKELYTISYEQFVVPLVKAVQEQQAIIEQQQNKILQQQQQYETLLKRIEALEKKN